ncbi:MAG: LacI family DNA-binding transcriptional regulator [Anaerolineae bacterium]
MVATLKDVARAAGVSVSTVSRVVRDAAYIDASTRQRVLDAIQALQYRPNPVARRLKYGRTYTIGFIIHDISNPFYGHAVIGAERYISSIESSQFDLFILNTGRDPKKEKRAVEIMLDRHVEGVILASTAAPECLESFKEMAVSHRIPVVSIDNCLGGFECGIVSAENRVGAYQLMQHLLQHGHRRIGILVGPQTESHARERMEGCQQALQEASCAPEEVLVAAGNWSVEDGYHISRKWLRGRRPPTAIFSSNNLMGMGALYAIQESGLHVPREVALVSFDGVEFGTFLRPVLTTLRYDWEKIGEEAARLVLEAVSGAICSDQPIRQVRVPVQLVIGESCGCRLASRHGGSMWEKVLHSATSGFESLS